MARKSDEALFAALLEEYQPVIRDAFLAAIQEVRDTVSLRLVIERLELRDIEGAIEVMGLDADALVRLERAIAEAYTGGGIATVDNFPAVRDPAGRRVRFHFGARDIEGERWLRDHSARLVTRATEDMKAAIRTSFTEGLSRGDNPTRTALDVVGKVSRATGRRTGGIIGLSAPQERYVASARAELLSGDPDAMSHYFTRQRRDRRFDRTVMAAIREGKPLDRETVDRIVGRYADRLLQLRGEAIGLNETFNAIAKSREAAIRQQIEAGKIDRQDVRKIWKHTPQSNPRDHHREMNGRSVAFHEPFVLPNGVSMAFPHSPDAPASETIFCKCVAEYKIDFFASVVRQHQMAA